MRVVIAIDGASRGNGTAGCFAAGAAFVMREDCTPYRRCISETNSTNQRGEMLALHMALMECDGLAHDGYDDFYIVTDSEFMFNTITKEWYKNWQRKGWVTASGEPVKNQDLWKKILPLLTLLEDNLSVYHIKGHVMPFGKATAKRLIEQDDTCSLLCAEVALKLDKEKDLRKDNIEYALQLFERNHGYVPPMNKFKEFLISNLTVDLAVTEYIDRVR